MITVADDEGCPPRAKPRNTNQQQSGERSQPEPDWLHKPVKGSGSTVDYVRALGRRCSQLAQGPAAFPLKSPLGAWDSEPRSPSLPLSSSRC